MTTISMVRVQLVKSSNIEVGKRKLNSPKDAARMVYRIFQHEYQGLLPDREVLGVLFLDVKNQVNGVEFISIGTIDQSFAHPREIFKAAILHNAASILLFHNHPTANTEPSQADIVSTQRIQEAGKLLGIELLDHLIIGEEGEYKSLKEQGLF